MSRNERAVLFLCAGAVILLVAARYLESRKNATPGATEHVEAEEESSEGEGEGD